jgi:hypothetical protein
MPEPPLLEPLAALLPVMPAPGGTIELLPAELAPPPLPVPLPLVLLVPALPRPAPPLLLPLEEPDEASSSLFAPGANASPSQAVIAELARASQAPNRI